MRRREQRPLARTATVDRVDEERRVANGWAAGAIRAVIVCRPTAPNVGSAPGVMGSDAPVPELGEEDEPAERRNRLDAMPRRD